MKRKKLSVEQEKYKEEFKKQKNGSYDLTINKRDFNGEQQAVMMSVNNEPDQKTSLSITGREPGSGRMAESY